MTDLNTISSCNKYESVMNSFCFKMNNKRRFDMALKSKNGVAFFERGSWYHRIRYYDEDFLIQYVKKGGFKTEEEAEKSYYRYLDGFEEQKRRLRQKKDESLLLSQYLQQWLRNQTHFETITIKTFEYVLGRALPYIPELKLCLVSEDYINDTIRKLTKQTSSYGLKLYELLYMSFADAFSECLIGYNPMLYVERPKREKIELNILSSEQKREFLKYARYSEWYLEIILGMFCGLKKSEIYGLKFSDFDDLGGTVTIQRQVVACYPKDENRKTRYEMVEKDILTDNGKRTINVPQEVFRELEYRKQRIKRDILLSEEAYQNQELVCCQKNGAYKSATAMNSALRTICRKAGVPNVTVQDLRDMYAEMMLKSKKVSYLVLKGLLGYSSITAVYDRYSYLVNYSCLHKAYIDGIFKSKRESV